MAAGADARLGQESPQVSLANILRQERSVSAPAAGGGGGNSQRWGQCTRQGASARKGTGKAPPSSSRARRNPPRLSVLLLGSLLAPWKPSCSPSPHRHRSSLGFDLSFARLQLTPCSLSRALCARQWLFPHPSTWGPFRTHPAGSPARSLSPPGAAAPQGLILQPARWVGSSSTGARRHWCWVPAALGAGSAFRSERHICRAMGWVSPSLWAAPEPAGLGVLSPFPALSVGLCPALRGQGLARWGVSPSRAARGSALSSPSCNVGREQPPTGPGVKPPSPSWGPGRGHLHWESGRKTEMRGVT